MDEILIISHKWKDRDQMSAVEQLCHGLNKDFFDYNGSRIKLRHRIGKLLIKYSNSKHSKKYTAPYSSSFAGEELWGMWQIIKTRPKVVFFPYADYNYNYTWLLKWFFKFKIVLYTFFSEEELKMRFKSLSHFKRADTILVAGNGQMDYLKKHLPIEKLHFFPLPINTEFFKPAKTFEKYRIVQSGINRRDFTTLFKSLDILYQQYPLLIVDFIGCGSVANQYRDRPYANFHGYLSDKEMLKVYQKAELQLLIAEDGGSSNSLSEGLACGLPMIVTDLSNLEDYINEDCSFRIKKESVNEIIQKVKDIFENGTLRSKMAIASREKAMEYSKHKLIESFKELTN